MTEHAGLRQDLAAVRTGATRALRRERRQRAGGPALAGAFLVTAALAAAWLACLGLAHLSGSGWPAAPLPVLLLAIPGLGLVWFLSCFLAAGARRIPPGAALAAVDRRHDLQDRIQAAAEFLERPREARSGFMEAALLDATGFARAAREKGLPPQPAPPWFAPQARRAAVAAVVLLGLALWVPTPATTADESTGEDRVATAGLDPEAGARKEPPEDRPARPPAPAPRAETHKPVQAQRRAARGGRKDSGLASDVKKTRGVMGSGQSADAASASGASEARGAPSSQAQASLEGRKPSKKRRKPKPRKKQRTAEPVPPRKPEDDSGATAGRGAASGSNKSPSASPWSSKDQVTSEDEEDLEDDEEVDDEFDISDARGGVQPHLRDRRPPVNRDLGIGFGNQKNPDANGRGGPSELKKSRGVASLVLGVPIPDHVKGQPNPGKTKITQERVEPKAEDAAAVEAQGRQPRGSPLGHLQHPRLEPWMRRLIRSYFQLIRPDKNDRPQEKDPGE